MEFLSAGLPVDPEKQRIALIKIRMAGSNILLY